MRGLHFNQTELIHKTGNIKYHEMQNEMQNEKKNANENAPFCSKSAVTDQGIKLVLEQGDNIWVRITSNNKF